MKTRSSFSESDIAAFEPAEKIGIVACTNPDGLPHITLITSLRANGPDQITAAGIILDMGRSCFSVVSSRSK